MSQDISPSFGKPKRKHVRTRFNRWGEVVLKPGIHRIYKTTPNELLTYVGSFMLHPDQTIEFYGHSIFIERDDITL